MLATNVNCFILHVRFIGQSFEAYSSSAFVSLTLQPPQLTKKEIEDLLKKGAYGALMEDDDAANQSVCDRAVSCLTHLSLSVCLRVCLCLCVCVIAVQVL